MHQLCIAFVFFFFTTSNTVYSQKTLCSHEDVMKQYVKDHPEWIQIIDDIESKVQQATANAKNNRRLLQTYTIPVVFHVLHLGEPSGTGSNISDAQILQALADLNADFANTYNTGTDAMIQFCLAQQDPSGNSIFDAGGNNITGIRRANASGIPNFPTFGIWTGNNEVAAKALSIWPNNDYVNIWVAHRLYTGSGDAAGFAYFPGASSAVDGIALRSDATGIAANSKVITHEAGHFLFLYHTFQGAGVNICPPNGNCASDGDHICETRAHATFSTFPFPCNESLYTSCDPGYSLGYQVTENHMNYTDNNCRDEFVPEQITRMRTTLETLRGSLLTSIGCSPGCTGVIAGFSSSATQGPIGTAITFTNTSSGASTYSWKLDGVEVSTATNFSYTFTTGGVFELCLDAIGSNGCVTRFCQVITIGTGSGSNCAPPSYCEKVINGDFEQIVGSGANNQNFGNVCGWKTIQSSPYYCDGPNNNAIGLYVNTYDIERVSTIDPINFVTGQQCIIEFDYLVTNASPVAIQIGLVDNNNPVTSGYNSPLPANATIIAQINNPPIDYTGQWNHQCYNTNFQLHHFAVQFTITDPNNKYLQITGLGASATSIFFIDNVSINCCSTTGCNPNPDFTWEGCNPTIFTGTNVGGDGLDYTWNFLCDGFTATGPTVVHTIPAGTTCEVCLTISCDLETSETICKNVTSPCTPDSCLNVRILKLHCDDKGTADPADDYWYFDILVTDLTGSGIYWTTSGDILESGPYGIVKTIYPNGTIANNPSYTFDVYDINHPECRVTVTVNAPEPCSEKCKLRAEVRISECIDPGTPGFISDDYFKVYITITGTGGQPFIIKQKFSNGTENIVYSSAGDQSVNLTFLSQEGDFTLWIMLTDFFDCLVDVYIDAPPTCSGCLSITTSNITCYDNGTTDPSDDYWTFVMTVVGGTSNWIADNPIYQSGAYGVATTIVGGSIAGGPITFEVYDEKDPKCRVKLTVEPPKTCSEECKLGIKQLRTYCKEVEGVKVYYVSFTVDVAPGDCYEVKRINADGTEVVLGTYSNPLSLNLGPFSPAEQFTLSISLCEDKKCVKNFFITAPRDCSNCIDYLVTNVECYDNGTSDPSDDYYTFVLTVYGPGDFWTASAPVNQSGPYGVPKTIWVGSLTDIDFEIVDNKKPDCKTKVHVTAPKECSERCKFEVKYEVSECKQTESGFVYYIYMNLQTSSIGCFVIKKKDLTGNEIVLGTFPPNTDFEIGPFEPGEDFTLWIMACDASDCVRDIFINAPDCRRGEPKVEARATNLNATLSPNPVSGLLSVSSNQLIQSITVYSADGLKVGQQLGNSNEYIFDTEKLRAGIYFVKIGYANKISTIQKFIKIE